MKIKSVFLFVLLVCLCACPEKEKDYAQQVDPLIGTGGHGHTYPGAVVPHGLVQLSPDTRTNGWDACSGYHYDDQTLLGFSHTHLSGTGIGDLGDVVFLPYTGEEPACVLPNGEDKERRYGSSFSHEKEKAAPGYYRVFLDNYAITAELTATTHAGFHRYTFPKSGNPGIYIDLTRTIHDRKLLDYEFTVVNEYEIQGMKHLSGWAPDRYIFFYARFSEPFTCSEANAQAFLKFPSTAEGKQILAKVGISFVDCPGAKNNLDTEIIDWNFDKIRSNARDVWNRELAKVEITTPDVKNRKIFYTALYHTALEPIVSSDVDGRFRTMDNRIAQDKDYQNYSVFSLWDTFRALHPLNTILSPAENQAMIRSLIRKSDEGGLLPMWELISNYTGCMIGYHAVPVIVDAYMKGQQDFDVTKAYLACQKASSYDTANVSPTIQRAILHKHLMPVGKYYKNTIGYIPADVEKQSVARGLEYAYDDWLIAQFAKALGKDEDCAKYMELSRNYKHYYDASTGFMRGKLSDGSWRTPFDARYSDHNNDDYCEGNAWQWTWFVPHDIEGLSELMGGRQRLIEKLDSLFTTSSEITGEHASADIAGLIGQYAHGNEPSHQTIHIYNVVGQAYKTQELVDKVLQTLYFDAPNGLSGNEDCGEMSAWYLLNSMGFYSYCPGIPYYSIGRPLFEKVKIHLQNGKTFLIRTTNNSAANKYIQSARLNGKELDVLFFSHQELMEGGLLEITMTDQPQKESKKL